MIKKKIQWGVTSKGHLVLAPGDNQLYLWQSRDSFAQSGSEEPPRPNSTASLGNLLFSLEKTALTLNANFWNLCSLLLIVLVADWENTPMRWEVAPLNLSFWRQPPPPGNSSSPSWSEATSSSWGTRQTDFSGTCDRTRLEGPGPVLP